MRQARRHAAFSIEGISQRFAIPTLRRMRRRT
jgi:hypothetical protein